MPSTREFGERFRISRRTLVDCATDARERTLALVADLQDVQLRVPQREIVNPIDWELGHIAHFGERFVLRELDGAPPTSDEVDELFDSISVEHHTRWGLPIPTRTAIMEYLATTHGRLLDRFRARDEFAGIDGYRCYLVVLHEDMHCEALLYTRHTLGYSAPPFAKPQSASVGERVTGDADVLGGDFPMGRTASEDFAFDNEYDSHVVTLSPYRIARIPVTETAFAAFVDDGGYRRPELWSQAGWAWRCGTEACHPVYWRATPQGWERRCFDRWHAISDRLPVSHVNWFEADAFCRWADRRLPTEAEWEAAALGQPDSSGRRLDGTKRAAPWGDPTTDTMRARCEGTALGCGDVDGFAEADSAWGCRQMLGNVWEWCEDDFEPYPGFVRGPYREYSQPMFGLTKILRGGCWMTRARLTNGTYRNFFEPHRRDICTGFRTCPR